MFAIDKRQWKTANDFRQHVMRHDPAIAPWARGIVLHHTWKPTLMQWRGSASIDSMAKYYASLGWTSGPHLYIAVGSQNPADDGIWQMTPLNLQGTHATTANRWAWGIEVVGNYDVMPWSNATTELVKAAVLTLCAWRRITISRDTLIGHREVPSPKTCPGKAIDMDIVRRIFATAQGTAWNQ